MEDLTGLGKVVEAVSKPTEKLIGEVSKGIGTLYRPRAIRKEGEAEAAKLLALERAKAEADEARKDIALAGRMNRIAIIAADNPELVERAKARLALQEINGQLNIESIADEAIDHLPADVSDEPLSEEWRQRFFKMASDVASAEMQKVWAKLLAGEIAHPNTVSVRTLDVLHKLSATEAALFSNFVSLCGFVGFDGVAKLADSEDYGLTPFGINYSDLMELKAAGLLAPESNVHRTWLAGQNRIFLVYFNVPWTLYRMDNGPIRVNYIPLSSAGLELARVVKTPSRKEYVSALQNYFQARAMTLEATQF